MTITKLARRTMLNGLLGATCALALVPSLAAAGDKPVIGVAVADQKSLFYIAAVQGMEAEAERQGVELIVTSANNDSALQVRQVNDLLTQEVDALLFTSQDSTAAAAGVRAANEAGVPVIAVDQRPESGEGELATYIATDSVKAARELCTWMFEQMGGSGKIAILYGVLGSTAEVQRTQGCNEALEQFPDIEVVGEATANWDETEALRATQGILTANPDLDAVFGESDAMAMGAAKAAQQAGVAEGMYFVGIDGFPTMFQAVADGLTSATMAQQPYYMGELAVRNALELLGGGTIPELQYQDTVLINAETVGSEDPVTYYGPNAAL